MIADGFLDYIADLAAGPLFPQLKLDKYGKRATDASKTAAKFIREVARIRDKNVAPSHSWRHTITNMLLNTLKVQPHIATKITGHSIPGAVSGYIHVSIPDMKAAIELLPWV